MGDVEWFRYMHTPVDLEKYFQQQQIKEKVEDIKGLIRSRKSKKRQYNGQKRTRTKGQKTCSFLTQTFRNC
jgi:hypothetical protein